MQSIYKALWIMLLIYSNSFGQISTTQFIGEQFTKNISSFKDSLKLKPIEESEFKEITTLSYYEWLEPISVKVSYLFNKTGQQIGKYLTNGKQNDDDADKLFLMLKNTLVKEFNLGYTETSLLGVTMLTFQSAKGVTILLVRKGETTKCTIMKM